MPGQGSATADHAVGRHGHNGGEVELQGLVLLVCQSRVSGGNLIYVLAAERHIEFREIQMVTLYQAAGGGQGETFLMEKVWQLLL